MAETERPAAASPGVVATLLVLIGGQVCLHAGLAGVRMAAPLEALRQQHSAAAVGVLMGLFAVAPILLALQSGRLADRYGYHRPMRIAVGLSVTGGALALLSTWFAQAGEGGDFALLCVAALFTGGGANFGMIAIQRTAGRSARSPTELKRVFSWLGLAPAISNVLGPLLAGALIDAGGFRLAFAGLLLLPLSALAFARFVPAEIALPRPAAAKVRRSWELFRAPGLRRLLLVNWLLSSCWDVHSFIVPILGHDRGFSASSIGLVLGTFAALAALVRLVIPVLAHRLRESQVLAGAMLVTAAVFAVYPVVRSVWAMAACAGVAGFALGAVQPMIMATLHQLTPHDRHGEAIALRSMTISFSSALMPLAFGVVGTVVGVGSLFWVLGVVVAAGSAAARHVGAVPADPVRT